MKVYPTVTDLLSEILLRERTELTPSYPLTSAGRVTPMDVAKLAIACERAFGLTLYDEKIAQWQTVADVCRLIEELLEEGQGEKTERTDDDRTAWYYE